MSAPNTRNFGVFILIAFATTLFCTWSINTMAMDEPMNDCATQQSQVALCNASSQGHLLAWQNFLPVSPQQTLNFLLLALLLAVGSFVSCKWLDSPPFVAQYLHTTIQEGLSIINPIRRALSRGIIQPQIYELAIG